MGNPTGKGGFSKGQSGNEGGLTPEEREARDWVRKELSSLETREAGMKAYKALIKDNNPLIVKDFMDRVVGKVKEQVEVSGVARPLKGVPAEALMAFVLATK